MTPFQGQSLMLFSNLTGVINFLTESQITAGYSGIRDQVTPLFQDFFVDSDMYEEFTKVELMPIIMDQLKKVTKFLMHEDRVDKILPMLLELLKDDSDEERRILGLEMLDLLASDFGSEVC